MSSSDEDFKEEKKGLHMMGVPTEHKSVDEQIDHYFYNRDSKKKKILLKPVATPLSEFDDFGTELLKVETWGFKNGFLQHNMPCPVCMAHPAIYVSKGIDNYFAPCSACEKLGYVLEKKKKGFWNG